ncbi:hypothetical protein EV175_005227 [Coemansia sp. RSA 1933]|nr:hypothetical protein EV175_005227 [Coemansia sp. RSA 1933]
MEVQLEPLLKYAEELMQSYSRIIVYSGDILQSLPEPREGLSTANIKPKKEESIAFMREWKHLESVFDEFLIRLNDIRTRAHEELEAARVKCLVGEDLDLTLPEAVFKLKIRLTQYKEQYGNLLKVIGGGSVDDIAMPTESPTHTDVDMEDKEAVRESAAHNSGDNLLGAISAQQPSLPNTGPTVDTDTSNAKVTISQAAETPGVMVIDGDDDDDDYDVEIESPGAANRDGSVTSKLIKEEDAVAAASIKGEGATGIDVGTPLSVLSEHKGATGDTPAANATDNDEMDDGDSPVSAVGAVHTAAIDVDGDSLFDAQSNDENEVIGVDDSNSDLDNEEMEDIFQ